MKNLIVVAIIIAIVWLLLKVTGFADGKKFELPKIISEKTQQKLDMLK